MKLTIKDYCAIAVIFAAFIPLALFFMIAIFVSNMVKIIIGK